MLRLKLISLFMLLILGPSGCDSVKPDFTEYFKQLRELEAHGEFENVSLLFMRGDSYIFSIGDTLRVNLLIREDGSYSVGEMSGGILRDEHKEILDKLIKHFRAKGMIGFKQTILGTKAVFQVLFCPNALVDIPSIAENEVKSFSSDKRFYYVLQKIVNPDSLDQRIYFGGGHIINLDNNWSFKVAKISRDVCR